MQWPICRCTTPLAGGVPSYVGSGVGVIRQLDVGVAVGVAVDVGADVALDVDVGGRDGIVKVGMGVSGRINGVTSAAEFCQSPAAIAIATNSRMPNQ
ncbi:MAG: hypothetical protein NT169_12345 [Chloroflexi bacterium]|nr:hypothetical protein [Chloroflexota bacterium]